MILRPPDPESAPLPPHPRRQRSRGMNEWMTRRHPSTQTRAGQRGPRGWLEAGRAGKQNPGEPGRRPTREWQRRRSLGQEGLPGTAPETAHGGVGPPGRQAFHTRRSVCRLPSQPGPRPRLPTAVRGGSKGRILGPVTGDPDPPDVDETGCLDAPTSRFLERGPG